ncbi:hypothetical protein Tco_1112640 [Tanacetum coccineum]|uniref:Uncharacterized protein n=1 Tax=Tanacetum coccineum TaxID=301880 RepID=A0ABQ5IPZ4_9ASTR
MITLKENGSLASIMHEVKEFTFTIATENNIEDPPRGIRERAPRGSVEEDPLEEQKKSRQRSHRRTYARRRPTQISYLMLVVDLSLLILRSRVALARAGPTESGDSCESRVRPKRGPA